MLRFSGLLASAILVFAQAPLSTEPKATLEGQVISAATGEPVRKASLRLRMMRFDLKAASKRFRNGVERASVNPVTELRRCSGHPDRPHPWDDRAAWLTWRRAAAESRL